MFWAYVPSSETNRRGDGWMLVRTLACARPGRPAGKVMVANRYLGNPTDRDDNGGLRNRLCYGSRTEAPREIEGIAIETLPRMRAAVLSKQPATPTSRTQHLCNSVHFLEPPSPILGHNGANAAMRPK
jgi:hypothetical protein